MMTTASMASKRLAHQHNPLDYIVRHTEQDISICEHNAYCTLREAQGLPFCLANYGYDCQRAKYYRHAQTRTGGDGR